MREIKLKILDNAFHCFDGKYYCPFVETKKFGSVYLCTIFEKEIEDTGYLIRLPECIDAEVREY
jgi:hypothetical protein